jgi:hypothetical protein
LFEWSDDVVDIREQFPMLKLDLAMQIANEMEWKYPKNSESDVSYVLTTDFMLTVNRDGKLMQVARTVKTAEELDKSSIAARLEVEVIDLGTFLPSCSPCKGRSDIPQHTERL